MDSSISQGGSDSIAVQALDQTLTVMLERLVHAYGREYVGQVLAPLMPVDRKVVAQLMMEALALEHGSGPSGLGGSQ